MAIKPISYHNPARSRIMHKLKHIVFIGAFFLALLSAVTVQINGTSEARSQSTSAYFSNARATDAVFDLRDFISPNLAIRDQGQSGTCWTFAFMSSFETALAIQDLKQGRSNTTTYDFSEAHLDYAMSKEYGRNLDRIRSQYADGGNFNYGRVYAANGYGPVLDTSMPFQNSRNYYGSQGWDSTRIFSQTVAAELLDTYTINTGSVDDTDHAVAKSEIKRHLTQYGAVQTSTHGAGDLNNTDCFNRQHSAHYCPLNSDHPTDHAITIVGWDDNYPVANFQSAYTDAHGLPSAPGAWVVRNSWGTDYGENGFIYISYEDAQLYDHAEGVEKASATKSYDDAYSYIEYGHTYQIIPIDGYDTYYGATVFDKAAGDKFLNRVAFYTDHAVHASAYVVPTGNVVSLDSALAIPLTNGDASDNKTRTVDAGYHSLEFEKAVKLTGDKFVVIIKLENTTLFSNQVRILAEDPTTASSTITVPAGRNYISLDGTSWNNLGYEGMFSAIDPSNLEIYAYTVNSYTGDILNGSNENTDPVDPTPENPTPENPTPENPDPENSGDNTEDNTEDNNDDENEDQNPGGNNGGDSGNGDNNGDNNNPGDNNNNNENQEQNPGDNNNPGYNNNPGNNENPGNNDRPNSPNTAGGNGNNANTNPGNNNNSNNTNTNPDTTAPDSSSTEDLPTTSQPPVTGTGDTTAHLDVSKTPNSVVTGVAQGVDLTDYVKDLPALRDLLAATGETDYSVNLSSTQYRTYDAPAQARRDFLKAMDGLTPIGAFDVNIYISSGNERTQVTDLGSSNALTLTALLPAQYQSVPSGYARKYYVVRVHENSNGSYSVDVLDARLSDNGKYITYTSDKFSDFIITYKDTPIQTAVMPDSPDTGVFKVELGDVTVSVNTGIITALIVALSVVVIYRVLAYVHGRHTRIRF